MSKTPLVISGLNGLVGSTFADGFGDRYAFRNLDISSPTDPVDITNYDQVAAAVTESSAEAIIHLAAFTDVTKAWEQRDDKSGLAYQVNVVGTENIAKAAKASGKHLIHISTAFVFDGEKEGLYTESDPTNPIEWYGFTKAEAEEVVANALDESNYTIFRIDFPFRNEHSPRPDIVRKTLAGLEKGYPLFSDHYFGPTYLEDFSKILDWAVSTKPAGLFHASSGEKWSDYEFAQALVKAHNLDYEVKEGALDEYLKTLNRPYQKNTAMDTKKLEQTLPFKTQSIDEALKMVDFK